MGYKDLLICSSVVIAAFLFSSVAKAGIRDFHDPLHISDIHGFTIDNQNPLPVGRLWKSWKENTSSSSANIVAYFNTDSFFCTSSVCNFYAPHLISMGFTKDDVGQHASADDIGWLWFEYKSNSYRQSESCSGSDEAFGLGSHNIIEHMLAYLGSILGIYDFYGGGQQDFRQDDFIAQVCDDFVWQLPQNMHEISVHINEVSHDWVYG